MIQTSTAKVYHGGGRRYFTKKAAECAEARAILKKVCCDCEEGEPDSFNGRGYPGNICYYHQLRQDYQERAIRAVLASVLLDQQDSDLFHETMNEMIWALHGEQEQEERQTKEQILTDVLSL
jgi:hypothetical protein